MLPVVDPNRNNIRPARIHVDHVMAALLWAQLLMPRRDFDRFMQGIQAVAVAGTGYISYKILNSIASVVPDFYKYIALSEDGKLTKKQPENKEDADMILKSIQETANKRKAEETETPAKKPKSDFVTPDAVEAKAKNISPTDKSVSKSPSSAQVEVRTTLDGTLRAPPGSKSRRTDTLIMASNEQAAVTTTDPRLQSNEVTKISKFPYAFEGIPRQYTTVLPYTATLGTYNISTTNAVSYIRMESVYDIIKSDGNSYVANPTVTSDTVDTGTKEKPYWRDYWAQFWEYWTVVETRWRIRAWDNTPENNKGCVMYIGYTGLQKVPLAYQVGQTTTNLGEKDFDRFKGFKKYYIKPNPEPSTIQTSRVDIGTPTNAVYGNVNGSVGNKHHVLDTLVTVSDVYHKGDGTHEVSEDALVETWIKGDAVPKEQNNLTIILTRPKASGVGGSASITVEIDIEYVVQYKDLKAEYLFPLPNLSNFAQT